MKGKNPKLFSFAAILIITLSILPLGTSLPQTQGYTSSFLLLNKPEGDLTYELNITIPQTLYQYYSIQSHATFSERDFAKFVTPYTLKPIADKLWQIYNNTEDFTNGVLMLVHQITYREIFAGRYPVETLTDRYGDCDLFVYIAASILEAGGIPALLIYYPDQLHMEIGVDIGAAPTEARVETYTINYQNVSYYIGECTGSQWRTGWRIGETPSKYQNVSSLVVPVENTAQTSLDQVTVTLRELDHSTLTLQMSTPIMLENSNVTISGQILPQSANENVTLKVKINTDSWTTIGTVETKADGRFIYNWVPPKEGVLAVQASWIGNKQYNGATSLETNVLVLPLLIVALIAALMLVVVIFITIVVKIIRKKPVKCIQPSETLSSQ
jgi:hypothetical protein